MQRLPNGGAVMAGRVAFAAQLPGTLMTGPVASTPKLWPGDKVRSRAAAPVSAELGQVGLVIRRCWFGRVLVIWPSGVVTMARARDLTRGY